MELEHSQNFYDFFNDHRSYTDDMDLMYKMQAMDRKTVSGALSTHCHISPLTLPHHSSPLRLPLTPPSHTPHISPSHLSLTPPHHSSSLITPLLHTPLTSPLTLPSHLPPHTFPSLLPTTPPHYSPLTPLLHTPLTSAYLLTLSTTSHLSCSQGTMSTDEWEAIGMCRYVCTYIWHVSRSVAMEMVSIEGISTSSHSFYPQLL